ncbi:MAG: V-type ATP synthase subunit A, partial [Clostridia bacterium]|nr:V-type ATP synthase subunit A [Clostridia bacterium]
KMEIARIVREDFLHQNAFHETDTYTSYTKQLMMMKIIILYYDAAVKALERGITPEQVMEIKSREQLGRLKYVKETEIENAYRNLKDEIIKETEAITSEENSGIFENHI